MAYHFVDVSKMVSVGSGAEREIDDIYFTRYACYLIAQNGDARKPAIAFAQNYFAGVQNWWNNVCWIMSGFKYGLNWLKRKSCYRVFFMNAE